MNRFPLWKNLLVVVVLLAATLVSLPNLFGDEPAAIDAKHDGKVLRRHIVHHLIVGPLEKGRIHDNNRL